MSNENIAEVWNAIDVLVRFLDTTEKKKSYTPRTGNRRERLRNLSVGQVTRFFPKKGVSLATLAHRLGSERHHLKHLTTNQYKISRRRDHVAVMRIA
jgi:hypothetical protein